MKPSNNNQPSKPDYSFIVNQANPVKNNNKKMVAIILIIALLSVATVAYLLQSSNNNVQKTESNQTFTAEEILSQQETTKQFVDSMTQNKIDEAAKLMSDDGNNTKNYLKSEYTGYWTRIKSTNCQFKDNTRKTGPLMVCKDSANLDNNIVFYMSGSSGSYIISKYNLIASLGSAESDD